MKFSITIQAIQDEDTGVVVIDQLDTNFEDPTIRIMALALVEQALTAALEVDATQSRKQDLADVLKGVRS